MTDSGPLVGKATASAESSESRHTGSSCFLLRYLVLNK